MAKWPFSQNSEQDNDAEVGASAQAEQGQDYGPFDGDTVDFREFNFSDFAKGGLDLGSMMIPVPHDGEVQVEMGDDGPQMLHIITPHGRITPVAFAAPTTGELWDETVPKLIAGMAEDGLEATTEAGPWGAEITAAAGEGALRVIGATGPRWMLRFTLAGPSDNAESLAAVGREVMARSFVNRGSDPIPAGDPLPVQLPQAMVEELMRHLNESQAGNAEGGNES